MTTYLDGKKVIEEPYIVGKIKGLGASVKFQTTVPNGNINELYNNSDTRVAYFDYKGLPYFGDTYVHKPAFSFYQIGTTNSYVFYIRPDNGDNGLKFTTALVYDSKTISQIEAMAYPLVFMDGVSDSSSAVAYYFDTSNALTTSGAKIVSYRNGGSEKSYIDKDGYVVGLGLKNISLPTSWYVIPSGVSRLNTLNVVGTTTLSSDLKVGVGTKNDGLVTSDAQEVQTVGTTSADLWSMTLLDENTYHIEAKVIGVQSDGTNRASFHIAATVYRTAGGVATIQGSITSLHTQKSNTNWQCTFVVSGNDVKVQVTGDTGATVEWGGHITYSNMSN